MTVKFRDLGCIKTTLRIGFAAFAVGALLCISSSAALAYATPSINDCSDPTHCQIINTGVGDRTAQTIFEVNGSDFFVSLVNTSTANVVDTAHVLTALLFNLNYSDRSLVMLSPMTALMNPSVGSNVEFDAHTIETSLLGKACERVVGVAAGTGCITHRNNVNIHSVNGEWAMSGKLTEPFSGFTKGIGSSGLDLFGQANFGGPNLMGETAVGGGQHGINSSGVNSHSDISGNGSNSATQNDVQSRLAIDPSTRRLNLVRPAH